MKSYLFRTLIAALFLFTMLCICGFCLGETHFGLMALLMGIDWAVFKMYDHKLRKVKRSKRKSPASNRNTDKAAGLSQPLCL